MISEHGAQILIADDQPDVLHALRLLLRGDGFDVTTVNDPEAALNSLKAQPFHVVLIDLNYSRDTTSGREGLELLDKIRREAPATPVVVMTAWGTVDVAVAAMSRGAADFIEKPWKNQRLLSVISTLR